LTTVSCLTSFHHQWNISSLHTTLLKGSTAILIIHKTVFPESVVLTWWVTTRWWVPGSICKKKSGKRKYFINRAQLQVLLLEQHSCKCYC